MYVTPILKKSDLDPANVQSYRPIANLSVASDSLATYGAIEMCFD